MFIQINRKYSSCGIGFDSLSEIFGADMRSTVHIDNKNKDILILGEGQTQG